jgi:hypothetical protein
VFEYGWIVRALWFANSDVVTARALKALSVLPPGSRYVLDALGGGVEPVGRVVLKPARVEKARRYLREELVRIIRREPEKLWPSINGRIDKRNLPGYNAPLWARVDPSGRTVIVWSLVVPTLDHLVSYAARRLALQPWAAMIRQCSASSCGKFFLQPKGRHRPWVTCGARRCQAEWGRARDARGDAAAQR